jgi:hypothetical protein
VPLHRHLAHIKALLPLARPYSKHTPFEGSREEALCHVRGTFPVRNLVSINNVSSHRFKSPPSYIFIFVQGYILHEKTPPPLGYP